MNLNRLRASGLFQSVFAVASGTALAQVVVVSFSPLITRIYSPEVFGLQGVFLSLVSILSPVIALRYPMAIITADTWDEALGLARLSLLIAATLAGLMWAILVVGSQRIASLLGAEELGGLLFLLPLALLCVALQNVKDYQAARLGVFRLIGFASVLQAVLANLARVMGGLVSPIAAILVTVTSVAPAVNAATLMIGARKVRDRNVGLKLFEIKALLKKHRDFPVYRVPTDLIHALSVSAPVVFLSAFYSPAAAGFYLLAHTVVKLPLNIVGSALGNVVFARFAELDRENRSLFPLVARITALQLVVPGGLLAVVAIFFPRLFSLVFGENWATSGDYAQWMTLWIIGMLVNIPGVRALPVIGRQGWHLFFNSLIAVSGIGGLILARQTAGTEYEAVMYFSIATATAYAIQILTYLVLIRTHDNMVLRRV